MTDVLEAKHKLGEFADELDLLSKQLTAIEREIEPTAAKFQQFVDDYELALYHKSLGGDFKLPAATLREKLAIQAMPPELYGRHLALSASRSRMKQRIGDLKVLVEAQRSILSAEKSYLEASESRAEPRWTAVQ